jgi:transposase
MASLQRVRVRGHSYWRIVESRRVNGKPRPIVIAHLGKADELLAKLKATETGLRVRSLSHGAVAALYLLAVELDIAGTIDRHLAATGARGPAASARGSKPIVLRRPLRHDGLSVGQSLTLAAIGRACHATSKRGFADWARTTTLAELAGVEIDGLTSQHFWDQMDQVPDATIPAIESEFVGRAIERFGLALDTVLYDATNFFTFIASTNDRAKLPARGHNKQKRHDLRQVGVALLCTRSDQIPLLHHTYGGQIPDVHSFAAVIPSLRQRLSELGRDLEAITVVYDRGNVSRANQKLIVDAGLHFVASLTAASRRTLIGEANPKLEPITLDDGDRVMAYRTRQMVWGTERTVVVLVSERLREGQLRGVLQHLTSTRKWLDGRAATLARGRQRLDRVRIERDIETRLKGRQHLRRVLKVRLDGVDKKLILSYEIDQAALDDLHRDWLGRLVLVTDRAEWSTAQIIAAYRQQSDVEAVFAHLKDPVHLALHPQFHWTDQKLRVHVLICLIGYLLARLTHLRARRAQVFEGSMERLLDVLSEVRQVTLARQTGTPGRLRTTKQLEQLDPAVAAALAAVGVTV